jgi:hypothetical protein
MIERGRRETPHRKSEAPVRGIDRFSLSSIRRFPNRVAYPLYVLIQVIDATRMRLGFTADPKEPWFLSRVYHCSDLVGGEAGLKVSI